MSYFANADQLYQSVKEYMNRDERSIVSKIPMWVHMVEDELDRRLRHPAAELVQTYTVRAGDDYIVAPKNMLELKNVREMKSKTFLRRVSYETLYDWVGDDNNMPDVYASQSYRFVLNKSVKDDTIYEFTFYVAPEKLSTANQNNFYLQVCGDFLLYKATSLGFAYDGNVEESAYYAQLAETYLANLQEQILRESIAGSTLVLLQDYKNNSRYY